jgi:hypothetical protein
MIITYDGSVVKTETYSDGTAYFTVQLINQDDLDNTFYAMLKFSDIDPDDVPHVRDGARFYLLTEEPIVNGRPIPRHSITFFRARSKRV